MPMSSPPLQCQLWLQFQALDSPAKQCLYVLSSSVTLPALSMPMQQALQMAMLISCRATSSDRPNDLEPSLLLTLDVDVASTGIWLRVSGAC